MLAESSMTDRPALRTCNSQAVFEGARRLSLRECVRARVVLGHDRQLRRVHAIWQHDSIRLIPAIAAIGAALLLASFLTQRPQGAPSGRAVADIGLHIKCSTCTVTRQQAEVHQTGSRNIDGRILAFFGSTVGTNICFTRLS
jgi:hypothetical protein